MTKALLALTSLRLKLRGLSGRPSTAYRHFSAICVPAAEAALASAGPRGYETLQLRGPDGTRSVCTLWSGEDYRARRDYFELADDEAELVFLETPPEMRGHGYATTLLAAAPAAAAGLGYTRLLARVWHSNLPSIRAFRNAGWKDHGLSFERAGARRVGL